eukprot:10582333-Ditylum_brightwellii.AAC.2
MSPFIVDIHQTKFTETKGIWMIETTKEVLHKASQDVEVSLALLSEILPTELFNGYGAFPSPRVILSYGTPYSYTKRIISNTSAALNNEDKMHSKPPTNAWNQGPPRMSSRQNPEQNQSNTMNNKSNNTTEKEYNK